MSTARAMLIQADNDSAKGLKPITLPHSVVVGLYHRLYMAENGMSHNQARKHAELTAARLENEARLMAI